MAYLPLFKYSLYNIAIVYNNGKTLYILLIKKKLYKVCLYNKY